MIFSSAQFVFGFLPGVLLVSMLLARIGQRQAMLAWLTAASLGFYAWWHPPHLAVLLTSVAFNFGIGRLLYRRASRIVLAIGICANVAALGYFKYANFVTENVNALLGTTYPTGEVVLPLAISFITFQKIAYLIDVYHRRTSDRSLMHYIFFASFFPQLIAGPIVHHREIVPQLRTGHFGRFSPSDLARGTAMFVMGLFKKMVLADGIAPYADRIFAASAEPTVLEAWGGALAYTFQIYFDFSGYTDMALGLGLMFGLRLPVNFNSPYKAASITDFWRRWHITLSHFLRDGIYIPLGGSRKGPVRRHVNLAATMLIGGLWHGAGWTFVVWGGLHGLYLIVNHLWRAHVSDAPAGPLATWAGRITTFLAVVVAWVFFRAPDFTTASTILHGMAGLHGYAGPGELELFEPIGFLWLALLLGVAWFTPNTQQWLGFRQPLSGIRVHPRLQPPARARSLWRLRRWVAVPLLASMAVTLALVLMAPGGRNQPFIYMIF